MRVVTFRVSSDTIKEDDRNDQFDRLTNKKLGYLELEESDKDLASL